MSDPSGDDQLSEVVQEAMRRAADGSLIERRPSRIGRWLQRIVGDGSSGDEDNAHANLSG